MIKPMLDPRLFDWFSPLPADQRLLGEVYAELKAIGLQQADIPFLIQLVENPRFDLPGIDIFHGATDLVAHDYIHIVLGRGLLAKDEAFVIGFTMGSSNRVSATEERLYGLFAKYLYPRDYQFSDTDLEVFRDAVRLGYVSDCTPLAEVDFTALDHLSIAEVRRQIGLETDLLTAYYAIEKRRYPEAAESQRLL